MTELLNNLRKIEEYLQDREIPRQNILPYVKAAIALTMVHTKEPAG